MTRETQDGRDERNTQNKQIKITCCLWGRGAGGGNISGAKSFFSFIFTLTFPSPFLLTFTTTTTAEFQDETKRKWAKMGQKRE